MEGRDQGDRHQGQGHSRSDRFGGGLDRHHKKKPRGGRGGRTMAQSTRFSGYGVAGSKQAREMKDPSNVHWIHPEEENIGHFFINKVFHTNQSGQQVPWTPAHLRDTSTEILGLKELIKFDSLEHVVMCHRETLEDTHPFLHIFPASVKLTAICRMDEVAGEENKRSNQTATINLNKGQGHRDVTVIQPQLVEELKCSFLLLRYTSHLRVVIGSMSWMIDMWNSCVQLGWYIDFPVAREGGAASRESFSLTFKSALLNLLARLSFEHEPLTKDVLFKCSPSVKLLLTMPEYFKKSFRNKKRSEENRKETNLPYGYRSLRYLTEDVMWMSGQGIKNIYQTSRVGGYFSTVGNVFNTQLSKGYSAQTRDFEQSVQIIYPSERFARSRCANNKLPQDLKYNDKDCSTLWRLHDIGEDCPVTPYANMALRYQPLTLPGGRTRQYGWMLVGSHTLGSSAWGRENHRVYVNYHLSVVLAPYTNKEGFHCAPDLASVGLLFDNPSPYSELDHPCAPFEPILHCLGVVTYHNNLAVLCPVSTKQSEIGVFDEMPQLSEGCEPNASVHWKTFARYNHERPPEGTLMEFFAYSCGEQNKRSLVAVKIINIYGSLWDVCAQHGSGVLKSGVPVNIRPEVELGVEGTWDPISTPGGDQAEDAERREMEQLGIKSTEEMETYLNGWYEERTPAIQQAMMTVPPVPEDIDLEALYPWEPRPYRGSLTWLQKHVTQTCHGIEPKTVGPYNIQHLENVQRGWTHHLIKGLHSTPK